MTVFPRNLFSDLGVEAPVNTPRDFYPTFLYCLHSVTDQKAVDVMIARYVDGLTLEEIGANVDLSKQRVQEICASTLDKLKGKYTDILWDGVEKYYYNHMVRRADILSEAIAEEQIKSLQIKLEKAEQKNEEKPKYTAFNSLTIDSVRISNRLYNVLARNNICNFGTVLHMGDNILNIRYLGKGCFWELADLLKKHDVDVFGVFPLSAKKYDWSENHE